MDTVKVILDTDIGSDIDDAVCLAYLLAQPRCDLLGITTVTGEPVKRAQMASALCRVAGRAGIPIHPGCATPLLIEQRQPECPQAAALGHWPHQAEFPGSDAIRFLRDTIRRHPGEVVLLAIGPFTNVGLLFAQYPDVAGLLKGLVVMGGWFRTRLPNVGPLEWNAMLDPHATAILYRHAPAFNRSVGIDVTMSVTMPAAEVRRRFEAPLLKPVLDFAEVWFKHAGSLVFHDPLAAVAIFEPGICMWGRGTVDVELKSDRLLGMTHWTPNEKGRHEIAVDVDPAAFFNACFGVF